MAWIITGFLCISILCAVLTGRTAALTSAVLHGASGAFSLMLSLAGPICLWSGFSHVLAQTGLNRWLCRLCSPLLSRLFPNAWQDKTARDALCGNFTANLLGLGNAATPLGLQAAAQMAKSCGSTASDELCRLVVLNTASIQLLPTTVASLRSSLGASSPFDILPAAWLSSLCAVTAGLAAAKVLSRWL